MGRLILPEAGSVYVDANSTICWFERIEPYASTSAPAWEALQAQDISVVTSVLTLMEVLVKPLRDSDHFLIALYSKVLLDTKGLECSAIDEEVLRLAARIRADHRLKTPDAIHAATALHAQTTLFLTNDSGFRRVPGLNVVILDDLIAT